MLSQNITSMRLFFFIFHLRLIAYSRHLFHCTVYDILVCTHYHIAVDIRISQTGQTKRKSGIDTRRGGTRLQLNRTIKYPVSEYKSAIVRRRPGPSLAVSAINGVRLDSHCHLPGHARFHCLTACITSRR